MGSPTVTSQSAGTQTTQPWSPAIPYLSNILGQTGQGNYAPTTPETQAVGTLMTEANAVPSFASPSTQLAQNLFNYSNTGTQPQQNMLTNSYQTSLNALAPYLNPNFTNPEAVPGFSQAMNAIGQQTQQNVDSLFAAAGRDPAGNAQAGKAAAIATTNAEAPYVSSEFNALTGTQQNAIQDLLAQTTGTTGALTAQQQEESGAGLLGAQLAQGLPGIYTTPGQAQLSAAQTQAGSPIMNLGSLESLIDPIAALGGQMNYAGGTTTQYPSSMLSSLLGGGLGLLGLGTGTANSTVGGSLLGGLGSLLPFSDVRVKENIEPIGILQSGLPVYEFSYKGEPERHVGVMAQEAEQIFPEAVITDPSGFKRVNYGAISNGLLGGVL
jgi:Chaperone of endosialidase